jgi:hypothetical protein
MTHLLDSHRATAAIPPSRREHRTKVVAALVALLGMCSVTWSSPAVAAPSDVTNLPPSLRQYVPGSPGWAASAWITSASCRDKGGDFSVWVAHVIADIPRFVAVFFTDVLTSARTEQDRQRYLEVVKGFDQLSTEFRNAVPTGYCVDDMKRWAGIDSGYKPFGFAWGVTRRTPYVCTDGLALQRRRDADNQWVGAERAACDGFVVACDQAPEVDQARCAAWNAFSERFTRRGRELRDAAYDRFPARGTATYHRQVDEGWVVVVTGAGVIALAGAAVLVRRRRRASPPVPVGSGDVTA